MHLRKIILILCLILPVQFLTAQNYNWKSGWFMGIDAGVSSFFGDLSVHDFQILKKINYESGIAAGFSGGKSLNRWFDLELNVIKGRLEGSNSAGGLAFRTRFTELSVSGRANLTTLLFSKNTLPLHLYFTGGFGNVFFRAVKHNSSDNEPDNTVGYDDSGNRKGRPENAPILPVGFAIGFDLSKRVIFTGEFSFRLAHSDLLDAHKGSTGINDRYSIAVIGIRYRLTPVIKENSDAIPCPAFSSLIH